MSEFLTEHVFDENRLADEETGKPVFDFKLDIALRGEIALSTIKGNHKTDNILYLMSFLMGVPKEIYEYGVNIAKEYFKEEDVNKLSMHIVSRSPVYYLYYEKVLKDLEGMNIPKDTKKSIFCRYIEDMSEVDIDITKALLIYTLESSYTYLHSIAKLYLTEINLELEKNPTENKTDDNKNKDKEFVKSLNIISRYPIAKSPTLIGEKEDAFGRIACKYIDDVNYDTARLNFAEYLKSKGVNVTITEQNIDDNGELIDFEYDEDFNNDLCNKLDEANMYIKEIDDKVDDALNMTNQLYEKLQNIMNSEYFNLDNED